MAEDKAICPYCNSEIILEEIEKTPFSGKASSRSVLSKMYVSWEAIINVAYTCPKCGKILGIDSSR
jgi:DNA-directed RNA polymerase subunit RPC12/RpoP